MLSSSLIPKSFPSIIKAFEKAKGQVKRNRQDAERAHVLHTNEIDSYEDTDTMVRDVIDAHNQTGNEISDFALRFNTTRDGPRIKVFMV